MAYLFESLLGKSGIIVEPVLDFDFELFVDLYLAIGLVQLKHGAKDGANLT